MFEFVKLFVRRIFFFARLTTKIVVTLKKNKFFKYNFLFELTMLEA